MKKHKKQVQFVVKTSKYCNLRCRYCYEYSELGNQVAITLEQIEKLFRNIAEYYHKLDFPVDIEFVWHGGEPLLQHPDFYWKAFDIQMQIFNDLRHNITNVIQTNLTLLDRERLRLLKEGFDDVGVSLDLFGGLRVYQTGLDSQERVLKNLDRLIGENIKFGCITVLTKHNLDYLPQIYQFYRNMNLSARILPLFKGAFDNQHQGFEINAYETLEAYKTIFDLWLADEQFVCITPVVQAIRQVINYYTPQIPTNFYDKREWESIYLVNTNGDVYSVADAYDSERSHGNIFTHSLAELVSSSQHIQIVTDAEKRMELGCSFCKYFGSCSGYPIAEGSREYNEIDERGAIRCIVDKGLLQYIESRLIEAGIINIETRKISSERCNIPQNVLHTFANL